MQLVIHLANIIMRHEVNRAVGARVESSRAAFDKFARLVNDAEFLGQLEAARLDPKGEIARKVVSKVLRFINLSGRGVHWGPRQRAGETTKMLAEQRYNGPASVMNNFAPDDVHDVLTIRLAHPFQGYGVFPESVGEEWLNAVRVVGNDDTSECALQDLAAKNPVACALGFENIARAYVHGLIGVDGRSKKNVPVRGRREGDDAGAVKGVHGIPVHHSYVKEVKSNERARAPSPLAP